MHLYKEQGTKGVDAELKQIHDKLKFTPIKKCVITHQKCIDTPWSLIYLKENQCGRLKYQICMDGRKQQNKFQKSDDTSPTVSTESVN